MLFVNARLARATAVLATVAIINSKTSKGFSLSIDNFPRKYGSRVSSSQGSKNFATSTAVLDTNGGDISGDGTATMSNEIFNLIKNIVGAGVLSLPAGVASFGNAPSAMIPAAILISCIGAISGYCFSLIGRVCAMTGAKTYRSAWDKTVGESTSFLPAASCTFKTLSATLAYSMILADTFTALLKPFIPAIDRTKALWGVTVTILLPLCLLKNLSSLAPFSLLGIIGMAYTAVAMSIRYFGGDYALPLGKFLASVSPDFQPSFGSLGASGIFNPNAFILVCMLSTAYMSHFNAPKFYVELKNNTIRRYNTVVATSFATSIAIFTAITAMGFLTFGANASGLILNNYSLSDKLMGFSRIAVAVSIVFSYPLAFTGARDGILDLLKVPVEKRTNAMLNKLTVAVLTTISLLAMKVKDLGFVLSFAGATLGNALIYVFPALMFRAAVSKRGEEATAAQKKEVFLALFTASLGVVFGCIGAKMSLASLKS